jgi:hypothetical protein
MSAPGKRVRSRRWKPAPGTALTRMTQLCDEWLPKQAILDRSSHSSAVVRPGYKLNPQRPRVGWWAGSVR